jgi:hypothetical protein
MNVSHSIPAVGANPAVRRGQILAAVGAALLAGMLVRCASAANITMVTANQSWLNAAVWSDNMAPSTTNDYFTAVTGNNFLRTSSAGGSAGGNADFTGNSLTVVAGTKLLYKQIGGETAAINGGAGDLTLDGQANAFNGIQLAPNGSQTGTTLTLDINQLAIASDSTIEAGGTTGNATVLLDAILTGAGNLTFQRQGNNGDGNDTDLNTTISVASVSGYTGNILVTRDTTLDFNSNHVFPGSLSLVSGPDDNSGAGLMDLALLNVDQRLEFESVRGDGTFVDPGSYSGNELVALNTTLGGTFFVDGGGTLVVRVPEPISIALVGLGGLGLLLVRRRP